MLQSFDLISNGLAWKVGDSQEVRVGVDRWPSNGQSHLLTKGIREALEAQGIRFLHQVADPLLTNIWRQGWKDGHALQLSEEMSEQ